MRRAGKAAGPAAPGAPADDPQASAGQPDRPDQPDQADQVSQSDGVDQMAAQASDAAASVTSAEPRAADSAPAAGGAGGLPDSWRVQLPMFEGPLDLLLHLVKLNRVEITDIPVATICDQFHAYLELMEELNLDIAGEYIYEAALLIHLKSKMLLPRPSAAPDAPEEDPRQELVERLLEYRRLKEAAQSLAELDRLRVGVWTRRPQPLPPALTAANDERRESEENEVLDLGEISLFDLLGALRQALTRYDREHPPPLVLSGEAYSVRAQFDRLLAQLDAGRPCDFLADLRTLSCRAEAIAAFLAVLELARLNLIRLHQTRDGEILLYRTTRELAQAEREAIAG